jgi:DNA-binding response OmpR family regulator
VQALARRAPSGPTILTRADLALDRGKRQATRAGRDLPLTRKELGVLEVLLEADGAAVSAEELLERVWDENADPFTRTVVVTLTRLRHKLGEPEVIETVIGAGYRLR